MGVVLCTVICFKNGIKMVDFDKGDRPPSQSTYSALYSRYRLPVKRLRLDTEHPFARVPGSKVGIARAIYPRFRKLSSRQQQLHNCPVVLVAEKFSAEYNIDSVGWFFCWRRAIVESHHSVFPAVQALRPFMKCVHVADTWSLWSVGIVAAVCCFFPTVDGF